jgi:hypothetical protein
MTPTRLFALSDWIGIVANLGFAIPALFFQISYNSYYKWSQVNPACGYETQSC